MQDRAGASGAASALSAKGVHVLSSSRPEAESVVRLDGGGFGWAPHLLPFLTPARACALSSSERRDRVSRTHVGDAAPEVSVVVLRYRDDWWEECRESILSQVGLDGLELLTVENHDNAFPIGTGLNTGAAEARAPFVFFVGDDDTLMPQCLELLQRVLTRASSRVAVARCHANTCDVHGRIIGPANAGPPGLWRKPIFDSLGGFGDRSLLEDDELQLRRLNAGYESTRLKRPLYNYRVHQAQASSPIKRAQGVY